MLAKTQKQKSLPKTISESRPLIGFDRPVQLSWLNAALELQSVNTDITTSKASLSKILAQEMKGKESQRKVLNILSNVWLKPVDFIVPLRDEALHINKSFVAYSQQELVLHWGMVIAAYPFVKTVAEIVGRLLRLQGSAGVAQVQRRIQEQYGEREGVSRTVQRIIRTFVDWKVLQETSKKGDYQATSIQLIQNKQLIVWLIEAVLFASGNTSATWKSISNSPILFPFELKSFNINDLELSTRLERFHQGLDEDLIVLGETKLLKPQTIV